MNEESVENNIETLWETVQDLQGQVDVLNERQSHAAAHTTPTGLIGAPDNVGRKCVLDAVEVTEDGTRHFIEYFESHRPSTATEPVAVKEAGDNINAIPQTKDGTVTNGEVAASPAVSLVESTAMRMFEPERDPFCAWWEANKNDPNGAKDLDMFTAQIAFAAGRRRAGHDTD
jgi:hypothetical protein